jgi:nicotinamidase-related amidase
MLSRTKFGLTLAIVGVATIAFWMGRFSNAKHSNRPRPSTSPALAPVPTTVSDWAPFALLLVDVQKDFFTADMQTLHADYPKDVAELISFCRDRGIEVIHLRTEFASLDELPASYKVIFQDSPPCLQGSEGVLPAAFAEERAGEKVFYKSRFNGFSVDGLPRYLAASGKRHLFVAGLTTDLCVFATVLGALDKGFIVSVVEDCCLSSSDPAHNFIMRRYEGFLFETVPHNEIQSRQRQWLDQLEVLDQKSWIESTNESST